MPVRSRWRRRRGTPRLGLAVLLALLPAQLLDAQSPGPLHISLDDAVEIALRQNPEIRLGVIDLERTDADIREARSSLLPRVTSSTSFTRDLVLTDPFVGTPAADLFAADAPADWVAFNEQRRTDGDPGTQPIPLPEFQARQQQAFREAGVEPTAPARSPFAVPNQFQAGLSLSQALYAPGATAEVRASRVARDATTAGLRRERAIVADDVRRAYLAALLAREQAEVVRRSVERSEIALKEAIRRLDAGVAPISDRLAAEVEVANLQSELLRAGQQEERATVDLALSMGLPAIQPLVLTSTLTVDDEFALADVTLEAAIERAAGRRPDLQAARLALTGQRAVVDATRAVLQPNVNAVLNVNLTGNVPDDRTRVRTAPLRPFDVDVQDRGVFSGAFWSRGVSAAVQLQWNPFLGGAQRAQIARAQAGVREAEVRLVQVRDVLQADVRLGLEEMRLARSHVLLQQKNTAVAERNYEVVDARVRQGVAAAFELREASEQLDRSRFNLVQGLHDYLAARSRFLLAVGLDPGEPW
jgi:outer membrane protein TolC